MFYEHSEFFPNWMERGRGHMEGGGWAHWPKFPEPDFPFQESQRYGKKIPSH